MAHTGSCGVLVEEPGTVRSLGIGGFQNGQLIAAVECLNAGNPGRPVGAVVLKLTGAQGSFPALALSKEFPDGVGLVTVGDDQATPGFPDGMVDDQVGILHEGRVVGLGADAVRLLDEHTVPGVDAAAHNEIGGDGVLTVRGHAQHDAPAGVGVAGHGFRHGFGFIDVHRNASIIFAIRHRRFLPPGGAESIPPAP